jgi:outer membrane protein assembly factor BamB
MTPSRPLHLRPGIILAVLLVVVGYVVPAVAPDAAIAETPLAVIGMLGGMFLTLLIVLWWLFFSRAAWIERLGAVVLIIVGVFVTRLLVHESVRGGHMGATLFLYGLPVLGVALVAWAALTHRMPDTIRRVTMVAAIALALLPFTLLRTAGVLGAGSEWHLRWTPTPEDRLLAAAQNEPAAVVSPPATAPTPAPAAEPPARPSDERASGVSATPRADVDKREGLAMSERDSRLEDARVTRVEWPGFRGPQRDGVIHHVRINTDWSASPPAEVWRKPIGPGWSSFAVDGDLIYTQEQRGEDEMVSCYRLSTGEVVWRHRDTVRFYESNAGAGPRATPTIAGGRVYAMGATGIVNALDARTGAKIWSRNAATDAEKTIPDWGIASSPLVVDDVVILGVSGQLIAYDAATGNQRWIGQSGGTGYSSPHLATIDGVPQVLLIRGARIISVSPEDGKPLWDFVAGEPATSIIQPAITPDGDVLVGPSNAMGGNGIWRVSAKRAGDKWTVEKRWHSRGLKPYFNDFVLHKGHAYGFDGSILSSIDLTSGERKWKGGRYGNGQMVLLAEQDLLLITSEEGELVLVSATPDKFTEVAKIPALNGKTWNHPVIVRDLLLLRNGEEMVVYKLPLAATTSESR